MIRRRPWWFWPIASTAGLLALLVFAAGIVSLWEAWSQHNAAVQGRRETAFRAGPLRYPDWLKPYLTRLPAPATLGTNGLRFVAKPELENVTYAAAFQGGDRTAATRVELLIVRERPGMPATETRFVCPLATSSYRSLTSRMDEQTRDFVGGAEFGTDGTSLGFERVRGSRLASGVGNWVEPYRALGEIVLARLREACPQAPLPQVGDDWYRRETFAGSDVEQPV